MELLIFYGFALLALLSAIAMITSRQPVTSALLLILVMFCLSGIYALLDAHLIAVLQLLVYAGAIMVLVLFVIMLLNLREKKGIISKHEIAVQGIGVAVLGLFMASVVTKINPAKLPVGKAITDTFGTTAGIGRILFTNYLLPFEIASILLLAAIVGAVILAKSKV
jgi:NADH-quinone oxidoreductase subunit J